MSTYQELDTLLTRAGKPVPSRKVANNTYAVRLPSMFGDAIGIKLHDTFVVVFYDDGTIKLDSGGWLTMTTKERMNRFLPQPLTVHSDKGRWMVTTRNKIVRYTGDSETYVRPDYENSAPYVDGIKVAPANRPGSVTSNVWVVANGLSPEEQKRQDAHNARVEKLIDAYLKWLTLERYTEIVSKRFSRLHDLCGMCVRTGVGTLVGDEFEDRQHLIEHLLDKDVPWQVFYVACDHARGDDGSYRMEMYDLARRDLRKYLRTQLYIGPVAIKGGKRPAHTPSWALSAQLNKSRRKFA